MYIFVILNILAFSGEAKVVEPMRAVDGLKLEQCIELLNYAKDNLDLTRFEVRCVKEGPEA